VALLRRSRPADTSDPADEDTEADYPAAVTEPTEPAGPAEPAGSGDQAAELPPARMRGNEPLYGLVVGLVLVVIAVVNLVVRTGKGAPAHPQTAFQVAGLAAAVAFIATLRTRHRIVVGIGAILAAIVVTSPKVPDSLATAHILGLILPFAYGLVITQRQRKALLATGRRGRAGRAGRGAAAESGPAGSRSRDTRAGRRRAAKTPAPTTGPRPSARYTPPKPKRANGRATGR
jgi:hypothetical protein